MVLPTHSFITQSFNEENKLSHYCETEFGNHHDNQIETDFHDNVIKQGSEALSSYNKRSDLALDVRNEYIWHVASLTTNSH